VSDPAQISIRDAVPADLAAICRLGEAVNRLHHEAWPHIFAGPGGPEAAGESGDPLRHAAHWQPAIAAADATTLVAERAGEMLGMVTVFVTQDRSPLLQPRPYARVGTISVAEAHRGQGLGHLLMAHAEQWARQRGMTDLRLHVWDFNAGAMRLYAELGYQVRSHVLGKRLD
jgi:GNAT superfamily N-acetyltransferase